MVHSEAGCAWVCPESSRTKPTIHFCTGYPRPRPSQLSVPMHEQELSQGQGTKSEHELIPAAPALGNTEESAKYSPRKRELGWVQLHVYIAEGLGSSFPIDVRTHEKLYLTFQKRSFNLRKNGTLTGGKAPRHVTDFRRNDRKGSFHVFCKSGLCPVCSNWKATAETDPTTAVEMHKHHKLWSRTQESSQLNPDSPNIPSPKIFKMATLGWQLEAWLLLKPEKNPSNSGQGRKDLLCLVSQ